MKKLKFVTTVLLACGMLAACGEHITSDVIPTDEQLATEEVVEDTATSSEEQVSNLEPDWSKYQQDAEGYYLLTYDEVWEDVEAFNAIGLSTGERNSFSNAMGAKIVANPDKVIIEDYVINLRNYTSIDDLMTEITPIHGNVMMFHGSCPGEWQSLEDIEKGLQPHSMMDSVVYFRTQNLSDVIAESTLPGMKYTWDLGIEFLYNEDGTFKTAVRTGEWGARNCTFVFEEFKIKFHPTYTTHSGESQCSIMDIYYE